MSIDTRSLGQIDGFDVEARLEPDEDCTPDEVSTAYSPEDVQAWRNDDWSYVSTIITASKNGVELGSSSLGGSEYGSLPGVEDFVNPLKGDGDDFVNGYGPELIREAVDEAKQAVESLNDLTPLEALNVLLEQYQAGQVPNVIEVMGHVERLMREV